MLYTQALLAPGLAGYHWDHRSTDVFPSTPVLTLVGITFQSNFDITINDTPACRMWGAVLDYLNNFQDYSVFYYGRILEERNSILVLMFFENGKSWQNFQRSLGTNLVLAMLVKPSFNRCVQLHNSDVIGKSNVDDSVLEMVLFHFQSGITEEAKRVFKESWKNLISKSVSSKSSTSIGTWVEPDVPDITYLKTPAAQAAVRDQPRTFLGLVLWDKKEYEEFSISTDYQGWKDLAKDLMAIPDAGSSKVTVYLVKGKSNQKSFLPASATGLQSLTADRMASTFSSTPYRKQRNDNGIERGLDLAFHESIKAYYRNERHYPAPAGFYKPMAHISQHHVPELGRHVFHTSRLRHLPDAVQPHEFVVDVIWLSSVAGLLYGSGAAAIQFRGLRLWLAQQEGCHNILWGRDPEDGNRAAVMIFWKDSSARVTAQQKYGKTSGHFKVVLSRWTTNPMEIVHTFPMEYFPSLERHLEIISFFVPEDHIDKVLFEKCYLNIHNITHTQNVSAGIPVACSSFFGGWQEEPVIRCLGSPSRQVPCLRYTGVFGWKSAAARVEWYTSFAHGLTQSYECLGYMVDSLQLLATGGVESQLLDMALLDVNK